MCAWVRARRQEGDAGREEVAHEHAHEIGAALVAARDSKYR